MADRDTTGTGGPTQNQTGHNPTTKGTSEPMGRTSTTSNSTTATGTDRTSDTVADLKQTLSRGAGDAADAAMDAGRQTVGSAQGRIRSLLEQQTDRAADQLGGVASALHKAAEQLDAENNGAVAQYAVQAADRVERVADMLRHSSLDDIVGEVEGFARRQPEVFIGAAFAVGFLAARFIKSSGERRMQGQGGGAAHGRAMAGGIGDSALRTPRRSDATNQTGGLKTTGATTSATGSPSIASPSIGAGTPKPTVGMPLSRAPASVTGHAAPPTGAATATTALSGGGTVGGTTTTKPPGQRS